MHLRSAAFVVLALASIARAGDHFLILGGGGKPDNEQISLEKNVQYVQRGFNEIGVPKDTWDVLFGSGKPLREVKFCDTKTEFNPGLVMLWRLYGNEEQMRTRFKVPEVGEARGGLNRAGLSKWFTDVGTKLKEDDRLIIYYTGHGGGGARQSPRNTTLILYGENAMPMKEFAGLLDKLSPNVHVILVMAQCHAGGFADVIFQNSNPGPELTAYNRCGFFATTPERVAAGCTPDIEEENYQEYSTYFWAAEFGKTRLGEAAGKSDFDDDGKVSFAEAHSYVKIHSSNIDIPICTSDVFLRAMAKNPNPATTMDYSEVLKVASPIQKATLEGLSEVLKLKGDDRLKTARAEIDQAQRERKNTEQLKNRLGGELNSVRQKIRSALKTKWPLIGGNWDGRLEGLAKNEGDQIVKAAEADPNFARMVDLEKQINGLGARSTEFERRVIKIERFIREAETTLIADAFQKSADKKSLEKYNSLLKLESGVLFGKKLEPAAEK